MEKTPEFIDRGEFEQLNIGLWVKAFLLRVPLTVFIRPNDPSALI